MLAFRRNRILKDIRDSNKIKVNKLNRTSLTLAKGNYASCLSNNRTFSFRQIIKTNRFQSNQNKRVYTIYHNVNCKSKYTIHLMKYAKCKLQCDGKGETNLSLRINNHCKDVLKWNGMEFQQIYISHKEITILTLTLRLLSLNNSKTQS